MPRFRKDLDLSFFAPFEMIKYEIWYFAMYWNSYYIKWLFRTFLSIFSIKSGASYFVTGWLFWGMCETEGFSVWKWGGGWTEGFSVWNWEGGWNWGVFGVEPRGFWCGTEGFPGLKRSGPFAWNWCVELRGCETEGDPFWNSEIIK